MALVLDYSAYEAQPVPARLNWFDQLTWESIAQPSQQKNIKNFLAHVYENDSFDYIRLQAVEWFGDLALGSVLRLAAAQEFLLDISRDEPFAFIQVAKLRYLFLLFGDDEFVTQELEAARVIPDDDIASEACYRLGLIHLLYRAGHTSEAEFFTELAAAGLLFDQAAGLRENRVDARFFSLVVAYLTELLAGNSTAYEQTLVKLEDIIWQRQLWGKKPLSEVFEWHIYKGLLNLRAIVEHTATESGWHNFSKEFSLLASYFNDMVATTSVSRHLQQAYGQFAEGVGKWVAQQYYVKNLSACEERINTLLDDESLDSELRDFLAEFKAAVHDKRQKKSVDLDFNLIAELVRRSPLLNISQMRLDFQQLIEEGKSIEEATISIVLHYTTQPIRTDDKYPYTGQPVSEEVFQFVKDYIEANLLGYPSWKLKLFLYALADLVRYAYQAASAPRELFPHLAREAPTREAVYHRDLFWKLSNGPRAYCYQFETPDKVAGGKIDITYEEEGILFPIEVKRDKDEVTWEGITSNYLGQTLAYTRVHDQLGFLVVFDISEENYRRDFRNYFRVLSSAHTGGVDEKFKNFVVAIVIPANNLSPSSLTKYSS